MMLGCCNYLYALYQVFDGRETKRDITISNGGLISTISLCTLTSSMILLGNTRPNRGSRVHITRSDDQHLREQKLCKKAKI